MVDISFLILTHNRPKLFTQCMIELFKLLEKLDVTYEVIVNNDSCDIKEILSEHVTYHYNTCAVNDIYKFLVDESNGTYVMFVEDDDEINNISKIINDLNDFDLHIGTYSSFVTSRNAAQFIEMVRNKQNSTYIFEFFQLSQMIFKKEFITEWPTEYHDENDEKLLDNIMSNGAKVKLYNTHFFKQGVDYQNLSLETLI